MFVFVSLSQRVYTRLKFEVLIEVLFSEACKRTYGKKKRK